MLQEIKTALINSVEPMVNWFVNRGMDFAGNLLAAIVLLAVGAVVIRLFSNAIRKAIGQRIGSRQLLVNFCMSVIIKGSWAVLITLVIGKLGVAVGPLIAGLGATGLILGFAFQESLGSLAAGIMIALNQPFKLGDYVNVGGHEGTVKQLDMMAVVLATADNRKITIPNKQCWGAPIVNYSAMELRRVDISVGIAYGSDIGKAREVALAALDTIAAVMKDPAPIVEIVSMADSAVALTCRVWVKNADYWSVFFAGNQLVLEAFTKNDITIPFPQLDVHVTQANA